MIKIKYILGNKEHAQDIKDYFASIGCEGVSFAFSDNAYFVNPDTKYVDFLRTDRWQFKALVEGGVFEELKYPYTESKPKLQVIKGIPGRGDEVINFLERLGGINYDDCRGHSESFYYYMRNNDPYIRATPCDSEYFDKFELEILTLPEKVEKPEKPKLNVIQGVPGRGNGVISFLESLGGKDEGKFGGYAADYYYFIDCDGRITGEKMTSKFFDKFDLELLHLPKKEEKPKQKPKLQVIQGDPDRGAEVIKLLEGLGGVNLYEVFGECYDTYYYIDEDKIINCTSWDSKFFDNYDLDFLSLPVKDASPKELEPFVSKVLVRINGVTRWIPGIYVCQKEIEGNNVYVIAGNMCEFDECIPYEGNEDLILTTKDPE